jgi:hypothetical protein
MAAEPQGPAAILFTIGAYFASQAFSAEHAGFGAHSFLASHFIWPDFSHLPQHAFFISHDLAFLHSGLLPHSHVLQPPMTATTATTIIHPTICFNMPHPLVLLIPPTPAKSQCGPYYPASPGV